MIKTTDFLLEIGTEELPPNELKNLSMALAESIEKQFEVEKIFFKTETAKHYASPRRLAYANSEIAIKQEDNIIERLGPFTDVAFKNNEPTQAALGFAASCGVSLDQLSTTNAKKGKRLFFKEKNKGLPTKKRLESIVNSAIKNIPSKRPMRWGSHSFEFVRPIQWVLLIFDGKKVKIDVYGVSSTNHSYGHRIHSPDPIIINDSKEYQKKLEKAHVIPDHEKRKNIIKQQLKEKSSALKLSAKINDALLNEVTNLTEWPVVFDGAFDKKYLKLPKEVVIACLEKHQRLFTLENKRKTLAPKFLGIANIESKKPTLMSNGFERVVRPRLEDACFFWGEDVKLSLEQRRAKLKQITFQTKLGTLYEKSLRVEALCKYISNELSINHQNPCRSAQLCKTDLTSQLVTEFPELQGIVGGYYAENDREHVDVSAAIKEHYLPKFANDDLPESINGIILSLADRLDTLVSLFSVDMAPTGNKDPYALRRCALAIYRLQVEKNIELNTDKLLFKAFSLLTSKKDKTELAKTIKLFIFERARAYCLEKSLCSKQVFQAALNSKNSNFVDFHHKVLAIQQFEQKQESLILAQANKRIKNILRKADVNLENKSVDPSLFKEQKEESLYRFINKLAPTINKLIKEKEYLKSLEKLISLSSPLAIFFDNVLIMVENQKLKENRLILLKETNKLLNSVGDISCLDVK